MRKRRKRRRILSVVIRVADAPGTPSAFAYCWIFINHALFPALAFALLDIRAFYHGGDNGGINGWSAWKFINRESKFVRQRESFTVSLLVDSVPTSWATLVTLVTMNMYVVAIINSIPHMKTRKESEDGGARFSICFNLNWMSELISKFQAPRYFASKHARAYKSSGNWKNPGVVGGKKLCQLNSLFWKSYVATNARPLSSNSPAIISRDGWRLLLLAIVIAVLLFRRVNA